MITKQALFGKVCDTLGALTYSIRLRSAGGDLGVNKAAEDFYCGLLNIVLEPAYPGIRLENMNRIQDNYAAIDLGDRGIGVAVQVTTTEHRSKVNHTLEKFFEKNLDETYSKLILLVIGKKDEHKKPFKVLRGFDFNPDRDIWDLDRLGKELGNLDQAVLERLDAYLTEKLDRVPRQERILRLRFPASLDQNAFVGRERERRELAERMADGANTPIVISGLGGMGKTELAARFCADYTGGNVHFLRFRENFTKTVAMGVAEGIEGYLDQKPSEEEAYNLALERLCNCAKGDILVIDNADEPSGNFDALTSDPAYRELMKMDLRLMVTTRCEVPRAIRVGHMENATLHRIFENHGCALNASRMDALIGAVNGHTMTVDLMARTLKRNRRLTAEKLLEALREGNLADQNYRPVGSDRNGGEEQAQIYGHLRRLFNVAEVSEEARDLLRNMVLLPEGGMDMAILEAIINDEGLDILEEQIDHGWLAFDEETRFVSIHPVIRLVCREELKPDDENCGEFLKAVWSRYDRNRYDAEKFRQFAALFSQAAEILPDAQGKCAIRAGKLWNEFGQPGNALPCELQAVAKLKESQPESEALALAYNNVGSSYGYLGDYKKALEFKLKALEIREKLLSPTHPMLAASYNNVGSTYGNLGDREKALEYQLKALTIREKVLPRSHPDLALTYNNVGTTYGDLGDHKKALEFKLKALEIREKVLPPEHPSLANSYNNVGTTYGCLGDHNKEMEYQLKALTIREKVLPPEHPDLALTYNNVGTTYGDLGDHKKALEFKLKALEIWEKVLPLEHPDLATSYGNVGSTYGNLGDREKALEYQLRALTIREKVLPPEHPDLALSCNNVGTTYGDLGDHKKALEFKLKALTIREKVLPPEHPSLANSYNNVGTTYGYLGGYKKALEYQLKALTIREKVLPPEHPDLANSYNNLGYSYGRLGEHKKALEIKLKALEIREKVLPPEHPSLATSYNSVGYSYGKTGDYEKGLEFYRKAVAVAQRSLPEGHPDLELYRSNLKVMEARIKKKGEL